MAIPNPYVGSSTADRPETPSWGLGDVVAGWLIAYISAVLIGGLLIAAAGYSDHTDDIPLWLTAVGNLPLWIGFIAVPIWAAATKGNGWISDFHVWIKGTDVPLGIAAGVAAQFILVPLVSAPILWLT